MKKLQLLFFAGLVFISESFAATGQQNYPYFIRLQNLVGMTGTIFTPTAFILPESHYSFGLHQFNIGLAYGLSKKIEIGTNFDLRRLSSFTGDVPKDLEVKAEEISLTGRYRFYNFGLNGGLALVQYRDNTYLVASRYFSDFYSLTFSGGLVSQLWKRENPALFLSLTQTQSMEQFVLDYDGLADRWSFGWRFLLSPDVCLDLFMTDITHYQQLFSNFIFGIIMVN